MNSINIYNVLAIGVIMGGLVLITMVLAATALAISKARHKVDEILNDNERNKS